MPSSDPQPSEQECPGCIDAANIFPPGICKYHPPQPSEPEPLSAEIVWIADCSECDWVEPFDSEAEADEAASFHTNEHLSAEAGLPLPDVCPLCGGKPHPARKDSDFYGGTLR